MSNNNINNNSTNQENDTNLNLVNTNNNVNTNDETNQNDSNLKTPIYWNDQNEEAFLQEIELQNLFANTLLHDDFNNDETDFNCLGIDNLQLNYTNDSSNEQQQQPIQTSATRTPTNSLNDNSNVLSSLSLISLNNPTTTPTDHHHHHIAETNDFILHSGTTFSTFNSLDVSNLINQHTAPAETKILDLNSLQILDTTPDSSTTTTSNANTAFKPDLTQTSTETIQPNLINQDDSLFKKPNLFDSFFASSSINTSNSTNNHTNSSRNSSTSSSTTSTSRRSTNILNESAKFTSKPKLKQQQQHHQIVSLLEPIDLITQFRKVNNQKEDSAKLKFTKENESQPEFSLTSNNNFSTSGKIIDTLTSNSAAVIASSSSTINKLFTLKRSRKRSKLITNNNNSNKTSSTTTSAAQESNLTSSTVPSNLQTKINIKLAKSASTKATKKEKKEKLKSQIKLNAINLEPLNKKLAVDKTASSDLSNSFLVRLKKEDVELHIKELSLLDLHSSEDDSAELLIKNGLNGSLVKNVCSSSNDNNITHLISSNNNINNNTNTTVKNSSYLNEILSKRIKYSPMLNSSTNLNKQTDLVSADAQVITIANSSKQDINNISNNNNTSNSTIYNTNKKERKIDKLIQYLTKSSLDSNGNSISSSTSSNESLQLAKKLTNQDINDNQSPPANSQNKRKKNEIDLISLPITINDKSGVTSNSDESSKSIENDTVQHMKNLDLNLDLLPGESKTTFKKNKHSVVNEEEEVVVVEDKHNQTSSNVTIDLKDAHSRKTLWNLLKTHSSLDEMIEEFGVELHDKISFWDLVKLKLKFSKNSQIKTTYDIIDDYSILYSNMSDLLESFVEEHSSTKSIAFKKNENSSRSRSSSRNCRKQSSTAPLHRI